jgi:hypothetical protein
MRREMAQEMARWCRHGTLGAAGCLGTNSVLLKKRELLKSFLLQTIVDSDIFMVIVNI